jgi:RNA polymerase sigma-70 factor (ECF subfamily)
MLSSKQENSRRLVEGFLQGRPREYFEITNWINEVVKNEYWGLREHWEDIIQDVKLKLYINLKQKRFRHTSSLRTYVSRIAKYTCIDYLRKKYRRQELSTDASDFDIKEEADLFNKLLQKEQEEIFRQVFRQLSEMCQKVLRLAFLEKQPYKAISLKLGIPEGTLKSRISRCIEKAVRLRKKFTE